MTVLKDLLVNSKDGEWGKAEPFGESELMTVIRGTDFETTRLGNLANVPQRWIAQKAADRKRIEPWDIIIETAGGSKNRPTGRTVLVKPSLVTSGETPLICASFARFLRIDARLAHPPFVFWLLQHLYSNGTLYKYHTQHTGVARFQYTIFAENEPLALPPLPTQQRIAAILSAYDDLIENNTRRIAILEEMARRLYEEWLLPQADERGWSEVPVSESLAGHIGGGWGKEDADEGYPDRAFVIRGTDIPGARVLDVAKCPLHYHAKSNLLSRRIVDGDLVMEVSGGSKDQLVGRPLLVSDRLLRRFDEPVMCASFCKRLQVKQEVITPLLLYHYLSRAYVDGTMAQFQVQSTGITNFQFKPFLEKAHMPIPPRELQSRFQSIGGSMRDQIELLGESNANLRAQRDLLLPKLVSGEIDVSGAEAALEAAE